jgi:mono/diheme cytochrome c family protein
MRNPRRRRGRLQGFLLTMAAAVTMAVAWSGAAWASPAQDYMLYCMGCHGAQAQGVAGKVPPLAHSIGRFMRSAAGRDYLMRVPGAANSVLSDAQLAAVLNWLAEEFNSEELSADMPKFTAAEVGARRHIPLGSVLAVRREVVRDLAATGSAPPADY